MQRYLTRSFLIGYTGVRYSSLLCTLGRKLWVGIVEYTYVDRYRRLGRHRELDTQKTKDIIGRLGRHRIPAWQDR